MVRSLHALAVAALACATIIGVYFRIADISAKTFFSDESFSALRITGHTERQLDRLPDDSVRPLSELRALQTPDARTSVGGTLSSIGTEEPQRGPLYYALATLWLPVCGTTIAGLRSLAVIIGLLTIAAALPCGRVIFGNWSGGLVLAAAIAVSPFHYAYARQTREYGLLALVVLASATALVWALGRERSVFRWTIFAASAAAGMLTSPLFSLVLVSFVLYVIIEAAERRSQHIITPLPQASPQHLRPQHRGMRSSRAHRRKSRARRNGATSHFRSSSTSKS